MVEEAALTKYDDLLMSILEKERSLLGFLSSIFNFLARRTDFYYVPKGPHENMGFPPGVAEELVIKILRKCDPKTWDMSTNNSEVMDEIMCSTVAQEVEIETEENILQNSVAAAELSDQDLKKDETPIQSSATTSQDIKQAEDLNNYEPPILHTQKNSDTYNGAETDRYAWSQTILEVDVIVKLPQGTKSSKDLKVVINSGDLSVAKNTGEIIIKDSFPFKIKASESYWTISEGKLLIHLEKVQEQWWDRLLKAEEPIDIDKIDCSRPLTDLPEDHVTKIRELQWNQVQKMKGLPTSDEIRNLEILKKAWNVDGSPFKGQEFDPNVLNNMHITK